MSETPSIPAKPGFQILPPERSIYLNGFQLAIGAGDIVINLTLNNQPTITLNASFTVAKSLAEGLKKTLDMLEEATSHPIMTLEDIKKSRPKIEQVVMKSQS